MTTQEYFDQFEIIFAEETERILKSADENDTPIDPETLEKMVNEAMAERIVQRLETDAEFRDASIYLRAKEEIDNYLKKKEPKGHYEATALIPIRGGKAYIEMQRATHQHLLEWLLLNSDPANESYIVDRVNNWPVDCKTLAKVESQLDQG